MDRRFSLSRSTFLTFGPLFIVLFLLTFHTWYGPDIWYHLTWGRDILGRGSIFPINRSLFEQPIPANLYWFFQVAVYGIYKAGGPVFIQILFSGLWACIAAVWISLANLHRSSKVVAPLLFTAFIICAQLRFDQRPEVFAYFLILILLKLLVSFNATKKADLKTVACVFGIQALLTNTHGYFALGPLIGGAVIVAFCLDQRPFAEIQRAGLLFFVLVVASFVSPNGYQSWSVVLAYQELGRALADVNSELFPTWKIDFVFPILAFWAFWSLLLLSLMRELWRRGDKFAILTAAAGLYLSATMLRNIPLGLILSAPLIRTSFRPSARELPRRLLYSTQLIYLIAVGFFAVAVGRGDYHRWTLSLATFGSGFERASYPIEAARFLDRAQFRGQLFTDSYDGGYIEFHRPDWLIAGDSYFYDPSVTKEFYAAIKDPKAFAAAVSRFQFDGLLINIENADIVSALWNDPKWTFAYADSHRIVFLNTGTYGAQKISTAQATYYQGDDLRRWPYAYSPITWIQYALKFHDRDLARKLLDDLRAAPEIPSTVIRGALLLAVAANDRDLALRAIELAPKVFVTDPTDLDVIQKLSTNWR